MTFIIQKYGGTSLGSIQRIKRIAQKIASLHKEGNQILVVLSAMAGETDRLINLASSVSKSTYPREYDALVSTGETVSTALMSIALQSLNIPAHSYTAYQAGISTDTYHQKARITSIGVKKLQKTLKEGGLPVVTGFQGVDQFGDITTLGRGGSDTTAVALAAALNADECQIYTDVEGVYTADPRIVPQARLLKQLTFEEMIELSSLGAKVLQIRSVEFAHKYQVVLRVLPAFPKKNPALGTLITHEESTMEQPLVSGVTFDRNQAKLTLSGLPDDPGMGCRIFRPISDANILVDMIVQNSAKPSGKVDVSFTVPKDEYKEALNVLNTVSQNIPGTCVNGNPKVAKLSIVGVGMRSHMGVATRLFDALGKEGINIFLVSTSEIKVSVLIDEKYLELGVRTLHAAFDLASDSG